VGLNMSAESHLEDIGIASTDYVSLAMTDSWNYLDR